MTTKTELQQQVLELPIEEQLDLVSTIRVHLVDAELPLHDWQKKTLDERLALDEANPDLGESWPKVKERVLRSL